jgi:hypothetical protein
MDNDRILNEAYRQIGLLIVLHNSMEVGLAILLADIAGLSGNGISVPIINTLDFARKCDLLKAFAEVFPQRKTELKKIAKLAEEVGRDRNRAAHSLIGINAAGEAVFMAMGGRRAIEPTGPEKLLKVSDIAKVAERAQDLNQRIQAEMQQFKSAHALRAAVAKVSDDPETAAKAMAAYAERAATAPDAPD